MSLKHSKISNQFLDKDIIDNISLLLFQQNKGKIISSGKDEIIISVKNEKLTLNNKCYSVNSFLNSFNKEQYPTTNLNIIKNNSKRFFCHNKIYDDYQSDFLDFLKLICKSNIAKEMQSLHEEFKKYEQFYKNDFILNDLINNKLKFYPFESEGLYGITDKFLLEIYLSSNYKFNFDNMNYYLVKEPEILIIFNMSLNVVIFQHEALNHFIRACLYYSDDSNKNNYHAFYMNRKISINTKKNYDY